MQSHAKMYHPSETKKIWLLSGSCKMPWPCRMRRRKSPAMESWFQLTLWYPLMKEIRQTTWNVSNLANSGRTAMNSSFWVGHGVTGVITTISGVVALLITGRDPACRNKWHHRGKFLVQKMEAQRESTTKLAIEASKTSKGIVSLRHV